MVHLRSSTSVSGLAFSRCQRLAQPAALASSFLPVELSFSDVVDLALARVVEADRQHPGARIDLFSTLEDLREPVPDPWVFDVARVLDSRGLVRWLKVLGRTAPVMLTGEGRLYVEHGGSTGVIDEYKREP